MTTSQYTRIMPALDFPSGFPEPYVELLVFTASVFFSRCDGDPKNGVWRTTQGQHTGKNPDENGDDGSSYKE